MSNIFQEEYWGNDEYNIWLNNYGNTNKNPSFFSRFFIKLRGLHLNHITTLPETPKITIFNLM